MAMMTRKTGREIGHFARIKTYPGGLMEIMAADRPIFREPGWEPSDLWDTSPNVLRRDSEAIPEAGKAASITRAMRRARAQVRDIALCNGFRWFVTLTLDQAKVDRYDMSAITRKLNVWLDNAVRRRGLRYVLVPERHKDGAIHFHGFFSDALEVIDSGTMTGPGWKRPRKPRSERDRVAWLAEGKRVVYNLPGWTLGFTTALEVYGDYQAAVGYVCKYIGKQGEKPGGRWYYSGGDLRRPEVSYAALSVRDVENLHGSYTFRVDEAGIGMAVWRGRVEAMENPVDKLGGLGPSQFLDEKGEFTFSGLSNSEKNSGGTGSHVAPRGAGWAQKMERRIGDDEDGISFKPRG